MENMVSLILGWSLTNILKDYEVIFATIPALIAVVLAYMQLSQIKRSEKEKDDKMAVDHSIKYVDLFSERVLPHYQEYKALVKGEIIKAVDIPSSGFQNFDQQIEVRDMELKEKLEIYKYMNYLDVIAAGVLHGHVNKDVCKDLFGSLFCEAVEVYYDLICYARNDNKQHFNMTVTLYKDWRSSFLTVQSSINKNCDNNLYKKISNS